MIPQLRCSRSHLQAVLYLYGPSLLSLETQVIWGGLTEALDGHRQH